jgi:26S proteasome regulatory subunit T5
MSAPASDPPQDPPTNSSGDVKPGDSSTSTSAPAENVDAPAAEGDVKMEEEEPKVETVEDTMEDIPEHMKGVSSLDIGIREKADDQLGASEIKVQARMIDNEIKMMRQESVRLSHERQQMMEKIADNATKIKQNKVLPYLVSKVVEVSLAIREMTCADDRSWMSTRRLKREPRIMSRMQRSRNVQSSRRRQDR